LVVSQARLLQQILLGKMQYLQARPDYRHGRGTEVLAMSTSPPSAGASSCTSAAAASSTATVAGAAPSCAPAATTSSTAGAAGSVLP
jgi:hypothetical protein